MTEELRDALDAIGYDELAATRARLVAARDRAVNDGDAACLLLKGALDILQLTRQEGLDRTSDAFRKLLLEMEADGDGPVAIATVGELKRAADAGDRVLGAVCAEINRAALALDAVVDDAATETHTFTIPADWPAA